MSFDDYLKNPHSKKIVIVEIDAPLKAEAWINYLPGIWFYKLTPGRKLVVDDLGNEGYWQGQNEEYFNVQSFNVSGELYSEVFSINDVKTTNKSWFYDSSTTEFYVHFDLFNPPEYFVYVALGVAIGFTDKADQISDNYFEDVYYNALIKSVPSISKKKDPLFFGIVEFSGGSVSFKNNSGYFDNFANLDLYGQPVRIFLTFEGLPYSEALKVFTGKVGPFSHDSDVFTLKIEDIRKFLSRSLPVNEFNLTDYPDIDDSLIGTPIPIYFHSHIKAPTYKI